MAQSGFQKLYGEPSRLVIGYDLCRYQGDLIFCGSYYNGDNNGFVMRLNSDGDTLWTSVYDGGTNEIFQQVQIAADSNLLVGGISDTLPFIAKMDPSGNMIWNSIITDAGMTTLRCILPLPDSGFIAIADAQDQSLIFRMNSNGTSVWNRLLIDANYYHMAELNDGSFIACGANNNTPTIFGLPDLSFLKFTKSGTILWQKNAGNSLFQTAISIIQGNDGNCYVTGQQNDPASTADILLMKIDTAGNVLWAKTFDGPSQDVALKISRLWQDQLVITGNTFSFSGIPRGFILRTDQAGTLHWVKAYGDSISNGLWGFVSADTCFYISGQSATIASPGFDYQASLIMTDTAGTSGCLEVTGNFSEHFTSYNDSAWYTTAPVTPVFQQLSFTQSSSFHVTVNCPVVAIDEAPYSENISVFPNPSEGIFHISSPYEDISFSISDLQGRVVRTGLIRKGNEAIDLPPGIYVFSAVTHNGQVMHRTVISL
jgi:hypothetical protein